MANENEMLADIVADIRSNAKRLYDVWLNDPNSCRGYENISKNLNYIADRIEAAGKSEAQAMERIVRDAIISYSELFSDFPSDDAERELKERAARANAWLASHGFAEEKVIWSKEESPCL